MSQSTSITQDYLLQGTRRFGEFGGKQWKAPHTKVGIISFIISHNGNIRTDWCFGLKGIIISKQFINSAAVFVLTLTCNQNFAHAARKFVLSGK